ncbi:hypothetical protein ACR82Z_02150 [Mycoplasma sp. 6243]|uniref:hypothetical protein n=1 Tax=Mycoplasma sp. 6243 TaxID=3440865 RepID=UPI003EBE9628
MQNLLTFFDFPPEKRKSIYTTNPIEILKLEYEIDFKKKSFIFLIRKVYHCFLAHIFDNWNIDRSFRATNGFLEILVKLRFGIEKPGKYKAKEQKITFVRFILRVFQKKFLNFSDKMLLYILLTFFIGYNLDFIKIHKNFYNVLF